MSDKKTVNIKPTTLSQIQKMTGGEVVELPGFRSDEPVYFRLIRPSMLMLAKSGSIPNSLLSRAAEIFSKGSGSFDSDDASMLAETYDVMHAIAEASMVEPMLADLEAAGVNLTDDQMIAIFNYSQNGVNALTSFREQAGSAESGLSLA